MVVRLDLTCPMGSMANMVGTPAKALLQFLRLPADVYAPSTATLDACSSKRLGVDPETEAPNPYRFKVAQREAHAGEQRAT